MHRHVAACEDADIDAADVVAFEQMRLIAWQRLSRTRRIGIDLRRGILQYGQVLRFLNADDVWRVQILADDQRRLRQSIGVGSRRQHRVVGRWIVHRIEEPLQVHARDLILDDRRSRYR